MGCASAVSSIGPPPTQAATSALTTRATGAAHLVPGRAAADAGRCWCLWGRGGGLVWAAGRVSRHVSSIGPPRLGHLRRYVAPKPAQPRPNRQPRPLTCLQGRPAASEGGVGVCGVLWERCGVGWVSGSVGASMPGRTVRHNPMRSAEVVPPEPTESHASVWGNAERVWAPCARLGAWYGSAGFATCLSGRDKCISKVVRRRNVDQSHLRAPE